MKEGNIKDIIKYRISRAEDSLREVEFLLENGYYNSAVNRLYYACFYAVNALLLNKNISVRTHSGTRQMFGLHFISTGIFSKQLGRFFSDLFDKRNESEYSYFHEFDKDIVQELLPQAKELISQIKDFLE